MRLGFNLSFDELININNKGADKIHRIFCNYLKTKNIELYKKYSVFISQNVEYIKDNQDQYNSLIISLSCYFDNFIKELFQIKNNTNTEANTEAEKENIKNSNNINSIILNDYEKNIITRKNYLDINQISKLNNDTLTGFNYRDKQITSINAKNNSSNCIYCHKNNKDSCTHSIDIKKLEKKNDFYLNSNLSKDIINKQVVDLTKFKNKNGCPLKQKISLMHYLYNAGHIFSALAVIMIDNPLAILTGHRICNDCIISCIFQNRSKSINTPLSESFIIDNILTINAEIYLLLTLWNPLNFTFIKPKAKTNKVIISVGSGVSSIASSYYMLRSGHNVIMVDGMYINKLIFNIHQPINYLKITKDLEKFNQLNFGGIAFYGITSRWNKNKLTIARVILERYNNFYLQGATRIGSNISINRFRNDTGLEPDYIILGIGAGKPYIPSKLVDINIKNTENSSENNININDKKIDFFAKNIFSAPNILMHIMQNIPPLSSNIIKPKIILKLPILIIGMGLTATDVAVEIMNYYILMVEKIYHFFHNFSYKNPSINQEDFEEYIYHHSLLCRAKSHQEKINIIKKLNDGVTIFYHNNIEKSSAYITNYEEIEQTISQGIKIKENFIPLSINKSSNNIAKEITFIKDRTNLITQKIGSLIIATGTKENKFIDLKNYKKNNIFITGDANPKYHGSIVKAIASAKDNYENINKYLKSSNSLNNNINIKNPNLFKEIFINNTKSILVNIKQYNDNYEEDFFNPQHLFLQIKAPPHYLNHHSHQTLHTTSTITHANTPHYLNHHSQMHLHTTSTIT
ncbi:MAG TPA: hypothetical protein QKA14_01365, partial [Candidatus Megaira endosymbiont of Hartmannula sinica]|nr:hypothetical protein [Candidatus Megaera endosymbiont of Hartmannula sinica]